MSLSYEAEISVSAGLALQVWKASVKYKLIV